MQGHAYARLKQRPLPPFAYREGPTLGTLHELETILRSSEAPLDVAHGHRRLGAPKNGLQLVERPQCRTFAIRKRGERPLLQSRVGMTLHFSSRNRFRYSRG